MAQCVMYPMAEQGQPLPLVALLPGAQGSARQYQTRRQGWDGRANGAVWVVPGGGMGAPISIGSPLVGGPGQGPTGTRPDGRDEGIGADGSGA